MALIQQICLCAAFVLLTASNCVVLGQQPAYSLQNMPQTRFSCYDKILGGYYADSETQCQMFHVCVKVAGVGVQDFRFLCPNGTAFDQEAQICADWGDVDCEQSVLYYGSDNFDLYRIGSGFESKRAPLAEEDESTFHLQRAESGDIRRSKETRIDQKVRPDQPPNYAKRFESTTRNSFNNHANLNGNNRIHHQQQPTTSQQVVHKTEPNTTKRPIVNYYTPTTTTTTTSPASQPPSPTAAAATTIITRSTTAATPPPPPPPAPTTERDRYSDDSKQDFYDDIFKGSHSSHFFSNRNGGREDDFVDHSTKTKANDLNGEITRKDLTTNIKTRSPSTRGKRPVNNVATTTTAPTTFAATKAPKKTSSHLSYNNGNSLGVTQSHRTTVASNKIATTTTRSQTNTINYKTQEHIIPTTFNPGHNYRLKATTPKYTQAQRSSSKAEISRSSENGQTKSKPTAATRKSHKYSESARDSTFAAPNEFNEFTKIKQQPQQQIQPQPQPQPKPQPFKPAANDKSTSNAAKNNDITRIEPQYFRTRSRGDISSARVEKQEPAPFSTAQTSPAKSNVRSRGSINYKATTQYNNDIYTPTTASGTIKKFSTLVPKELYTPPTTFKPSGIHKKTFEQTSYQTQQTIRPSANQQKPYSTVTTTAAPTTPNPYYNIDEDDGQYHPELYETDAPKSHSNIQRSTTKLPATTAKTIITTTKRTPNGFNLNYENAQSHLKTQQQSAFQKQQELSDAGGDLSDEDELFKTAHSLNFGAASINKLRADIFKAEKTSQQYNSQYSPNLPTATSPKPFSTSAATSKPFTNNLITLLPSTTSTTTTTTTTTTRRPQTTTTITYPTKKPSKPSKNKKATKFPSKRPPHADEDTSYDYAYYDTDTLSESPQDYSEYEIAEFRKTRKN